MSQHDYAPITDIKVPFNDAISYRQPKYHKDLKSIFIDNNKLDSIINEKTFYLIGEKGTGKSAYAVYISNESYKDVNGKIKFIHQTEYKRFVELMKDGKIQYSDMSNVWEVILLLLLSEEIYHDSVRWYNKMPWGNLSKLKQVIDQFYSSAFAPEVENAIEFVRNLDQSVEIIHKVFKGKFRKSTEQTETKKNTQLNLMLIKKAFYDCLKDIKYEKKIILFIDGIDIRPNNISNSDYRGIIQGLAEAHWDLNSNLLPSMTGNSGLIKVVLLVRPDIFGDLRLQNSNSKLFDHSIYISWSTTKEDHRKSAIFEVADEILKAGRKKDRGHSWDFYFPPDKFNFDKNDSVFPAFLNASFHKPRDVVTIIKLLIESRKNNISAGQTFYFDRKEVESPSFTRFYSDYLLGEVKDYCRYYISDETFDCLQNFFLGLKGHSEFDVKMLQSAFSQMCEVMKKRGIRRPESWVTMDSFLQFLYDQSLIGYLDKTKDERFYHWCYRERTVANLHPKIRMGAKYKVHHGIAKAVDIGKTFL